MQTRGRHTIEEMFGNQQAANLSQGKRCEHIVGMAPGNATIPGLLANRISDSVLLGDKFLFSDSVVYTEQLYDRT